MYLQTDRYSCGWKIRGVANVMLLVQSLMVPLTMFAIMRNVAAIWFALVSTLVTISAVRIFLEGLRYRMTLFLLPLIVTQLVLIPTWLFHPAIHGIYRARPLISTPAPWTVSTPQPEFYSADVSAVLLIGIALVQVALLKVSVDTLRLIRRPPVTSSLSTIRGVSNVGVTLPTLLLSPSSPSGGGHSATITPATTHYHQLHSWYHLNRAGVLENGCPDADNTTGKSVRVETGPRKYEVHNASDGNLLSVSREICPFTHKNNSNTDPLMPIAESTLNKK